MSRYEDPHAWIDRVLAQHASEREEQERKQERQVKAAQEMWSLLAVYFQGATQATWEQISDLYAEHRNDFREPRKQQAQTSGEGW